MDLNTALMESITTMSEYFVAANTRTSFTELAESGSLNPLAGNQQNHHPNQLHGGPHNLGTNMNSSQQQQQQQQQQHHHFPPTIMPAVHKTLVAHSNHQHMAQQMHQQQLQQQQHHQLDANNHNNSTTANSNNNNTSTSNNSNSTPNNNSSSSPSSSSSLHSNLNSIQYHNHIYSAGSSNNNNNANNNNGATSNSSASVNNGTNTQSRLSQPVRTQIPIHCYIEQLDACADVPGCSSSLNDNDLFTTSNSTNIKSAQQQNSHQQNHLHLHHQHNHQLQPHLHQSKLALESITNGSASLASINTASGLFDDQNDTNNDNNDLESNLEHVNSSSPLSIHPQNTAQQQATSNNNNNVQTGSINSSSSSGSSNRQASSYDNHHFQSCRETYAIVTSNVLYIDLVRTVLLQLGYSAMDLINAKATIQIKNWRPLALDQVTEDKRATVGEVLGDISTFVTLRIRLYSSVTQLPTEWTETMIRQVVLALTQTMSQLTLSKLCNISQPLISAIVRGGKKLGRRKCAEFGQWYMNYIKSAEARPSTMFCEGSGARLVFDKAREIPQLKAWFSNNTKPSDELLEEYSKILNQHALRKDSKPQVTAKTLRNWWKNERQKLGIRQREIRGRPKTKRID